MNTRWDISFQIIKKKILFFSSSYVWFILMNAFNKILSNLQCKSLVIIWLFLTHLWIQEY